MSVNSDLLASCRCGDFYNDKTISMCTDTIKNHGNALSYRSLISSPRWSVKSTVWQFDFNISLIFKMSKRLYFVFCQYNLNVNILKPVIHWRRRLKQQEDKVTVNQFFIQVFTIKSSPLYSTQAVPRCTKFFSFYQDTATVLTALRQHRCTFIIIHHRKQCACGLMCTADCQQWMQWHC